MKNFNILSLTLAMSLTTVCGSALAQAAPSAAPATRAEVKMDAAEFKKTHVYDQVMDVWVVKSDMEPPQGMKSRAQIKAERDEFLRNNRWSENGSVWIPLKGKPRDMSTMTREQVKAETIAFTKTHRWDENTETWMLKGAKGAK